MLAVLGVDPSLRMTGLARVGEDGRVRVKRLPTGSTDGTIAATSLRISAIVGATLEFAPPWCVTVIEGPALARGGASGQFMERCWLFGSLVEHMLRRGPVVVVAPATRAVYAADDGHADKKAVLAAMRRRFPKVPLLDDNQADALALAAMGARWAGHPIDTDISVKQLHAMTVPAWPVGEGRAAS